MRIAKIIGLWVCGLLAGIGVGGLLEEFQGSFSGWGAFAGAMVFATARLWYVLDRENSN